MLSLPNDRPHSRLSGAALCALLAVALLASATVRIDDPAMVTAPALAPPVAAPAAPPAQHETAERSPDVGRLERFSLWADTAMRARRAWLFLAALPEVLWPSVSPTAPGDPLFDCVYVPALPMGMQNSNPGNIKFDVANYWQGQLGRSVNTDQGVPQVVFDNASDGMLAAAQLVLRRYAWGHDTVRDLIANRRVGWTPGYVAGAEGVAAAAGFRLNQHLNLRDPKVLAQLLRGIVTQEHGPASRLYPDQMIEQAANAALATADVRRSGAA